MAVLVFVLATSAAPAFAQAICGYPKLISPKSAYLSDNKPVVEWEATPNAQYYRVMITSRLPEGRILTAIDTQTSATRFVPPLALATMKANVRIGVTAYCGSEPSKQPAVQDPTRFLIDASGNCALKTQAHIDGTGLKRTVRWDAVPGASAYQITVYDAANAAPVERKTTRVPNVELDVPADKVVIVGIRPECATGGGEQIHALIVPQ